MKNILLFIGMLLVCNIQAQDALTMLKFEDAETAFNAGDYNRTLEKIEEVEKEVGATSKTLYLKIMAQKELLGVDHIDFTDPSTTFDFALFESLLENSQTYLNLMKEQGLDDRFREVHNLQEKLGHYPKNEEELKSMYSKPYEKVFEKYYTSIGSQDKIALVETVVLEENQKNEYDNQYIENSSSTITSKKAVGKYYLNIEGPYGSKTIFNKEKGIYDGILFTSNFEYTKNLYDKLTSSSLSLVSQLPFTIDDIQSLKIRQGDFGDEAATIIHQQEEANSIYYSINYYFSDTSGRLIGTVTSMQGGTVTVMRYSDFRQVKELTFPFKRTVKTYQLSEYGKKDYDPKEGLGDEMLAVLMQQDNYQSITTNTTTLLKINEHIPESIFE